MKKFNYEVRRLFGKDVKIIKNCCTRKDMSCCGGGSTCCKSLFLHINSYCNSKCYFCISDKKKAEIRNFDKLKKVLDELTHKNIISKVVLTGGEPLLHHNFIWFLNNLDKYNLQYYSLNTNGTLLGKWAEDINKSKLKHINISMHHYDNSKNKEIMGKCLSNENVKFIRKEISLDKEIRLACTITKDLYTEDDIYRYIDNAKSLGVDNVIFRNEYSGYSRYLDSFKKIWKKLFYADICNCGYKFIRGVNAEYRQSDIFKKQKICQKDLYYRDFIYKDDDVLGGSWEYGSQALY